MAEIPYDKKAFRCNVKFPSRIPTFQQMRLAHEEGWSSKIRTLQDEIAVAEGCRFDLAKPIAIENLFAKRFKHSKDPFYKQPFHLLPWQREQIIEPLYGWYTADAFRRFRSMFVFIPKKNGKTQLLAGIGLTEMIFVRGSRVYVVAVSEGQAGELYDEAAFMVEQSPELIQYIKVLRSTHTLNWMARNSRLSCLTKSAAASEGKNASCLILDELHAWTDRKLFDSLLYAGATKLNPLLAMITTAGDDMTSLCYSEYERAKRIIDGDDPSTDHLAVIYEAKPEDKWDDLEAWRRANPSYGVTLPERNILADIHSARGNPERISAIKRYRLNIWTQGGTAWLSTEAWKDLDLCDENSVYGTLFGGVDLARTRDFAAFLMLFHHDDGGFDLLPKIYIPQSQVKHKEEQDKIPLSAWIEAGWVIATDGDEIDQELIAGHITQANERWRFAEVGYDSYNAAGLAKHLRSNGIIATAVPQTMAYLGYPSAEFERALTDRRIRHDGNPCMKWMVGNAKVISDSNNNVRPCKKKSNKRIDGLVASIIALQRALSPDHQPVSDDPYQWV